MPTSKKLPSIVLEKARAQAALSKQYTIAPVPAASPAPVAAQPATKKTKVVAALKRLHPMD